MWICGYDFFLSIVSKDCAPDELLVRARRPGDIEKIFPEARITEYDCADYLYRAVLPKIRVIAAIATEIEDIDYGNFKNTVKDNKLHNAYLRIWSEMAMLQPKAPYSGVPRTSRETKAKKTHKKR